MRDGNRFFENATGIKIGSDDPNGDAVLPAHGVYVVGNLIGAPSWDFDFSNFCERSFIGVHVYGSSDVFIGGAAEWERNVIVNNQRGIDLVGASRTTVYNNYIGTLDGYTPLGNYTGISISHLDHDGPAGPILSSDVALLNPSGLG